MRYTTRKSPRWALCLPSSSNRSGRPTRLGLSAVDNLREAILHLGEGYMVGWWSHGQKYG